MSETEPTLHYKLDDASEVVITDQAKQKQSWLGYLWDTADLGPEERKLLFKVDASLLIFASLGYFVKNLDQTNVTNAYLSGMQEDLGMYGNELVTSTSIWTVGYVVGQIPFNLLMTRVSPRWIIPSLELGWGIATLATYAITNMPALYALRFLVGFLESGFYPGIHFILGSWYTPRELAKRSTIFWTAGTIGQMFAGILQSAAYTNLNGVHGLAGWRWMFIIDAIITLPIAVLGFIFLPKLPWEKNPSFWLSDREVALARARLKAIGRKEAAPWTKARVKKLFTTWHIYVLPIIYVIWNNAWPQQAMGYYLKSFNATPAPVPGTTFTVSQINLLPLPTNGIQVVGAYIFAWLSDGPYKGRRWPNIYIGAVYGAIIAFILYSIPLYDSIKGHFALYYLQGLCSGAGPQILNWISEISSGDTEVRSLLVAMANDFAYVVQAVAPNFVWKTTDFPAARKGFAWSGGLNIFLIFWTTGVLLLLRYDRKNKADVESVADSEGEDNDRKGSLTDSQEGLNAKP